MPLGVGKLGQNVGLTEFAIFSWRWFFCTRGHPCFTNTSRFKIVFEKHTWLYVAFIVFLFYFQHSVSPPHSPCKYSFHVHNIGKIPNLFITADSPHLQMHCGYRKLQVSLRNGDRAINTCNTQDFNLGNKNSVIKIVGKRETMEKLRALQEEAGGKGFLCCLVLFCQQMVRLHAPVQCVIIHPNHRLTST